MAICAICKDDAAGAVRAVESPCVVARYMLYACRSCASEFFDPLEHDVPVADLYEEGGGYDSGAEFKPSTYWRNEVKRLTTLHGGKVRSVLDIGCRNGDFLLHWPESVERVGVELAERAADVAERRGLTVVRRPVEQYQPPRPFSVVTLYAVLEHLFDPVAFLARLAPLAEPGGIVALMIPTHQCLKQRLLAAAGRRWHMHYPPLHVTFIGRDKLDELLWHNGFRLLQRRYTSGGMFNPFGRVPLLRPMWNRLMWYADAYTPINRLPIFDHMYSYYIKR